MRLCGPGLTSSAGAGDFARARADRTAAVSTKKYVFLGFGLEQVTGPAQRRRTCVPPSGDDRARSEVRPRRPRRSRATSHMSFLPPPPALVDGAGRTRGGALFPLLRGPGFDSPEKV
ncbi:MULTISPECIES: hypothetical protein [unclassified Streptosporangium]|uniref:hypothetical protein n=1 Tax=unclassified Streptosporangium TaxID=2632669 RepID=UPI002E282DAC|nr:MULTISPECIES: hypothetical protein [unclassified Streptosporangium]